MRARGMPARSASASERSKKPRMSASMSTSGSTVSRLCMTTTAAPLSATTPAIAGSFCNPQTSLTIETPAAMARRAISALYVSIETGAETAATSGPISGARRRHSSSSGTGVWPGRVDSAPTSITSAPSSTSLRACACAVSVDSKRPPSENESGVTLRMPMMTGLTPTRLRKASRRRSRSAFAGSAVVASVMTKTIARMSPCIQAAVFGRLDHAPAGGGVRACRRFSSTGPRRGREADPGQIFLPSGPNCLR